MRIPSKQLGSKAATVLELPYETGVYVGAAVYMKESGLVTVADRSDISTAPAFGIVEEISGSLAYVRVSGITESIGYITFTPGKKVFLDSNGHLTHTFHTEGISLPMGRAVTSSRVQVMVENLIIWEEV